MALLVRFRDSTRSSCMVHAFAGLRLKPNKQGGKYPPDTASIYYKFVAYEVRYLIYRGRDTPCLQGLNRAYRAQPRPRCMNWRSQPNL